MKANSRFRKLSELEGVVLGIINKTQPCTAYTLRNKLKQAPSSHWRASAGSIYPLLTRLTSEKLLSSARDTNDGRDRDFLSITKQGLLSLKAWIKTGVEQNIISSVLDPVRSRMFFLDVLSASERIAFTEQLITAMQQYVTETQNHLANKSAGHDLFDYLGSLGAQASAESRLDWLLHVRQQLDENSTG